MDKLCHYHLVKLLLLPAQAIRSIGHRSAVLLVLVLLAAAAIPVCLASNGTPSQHVSLVLVIDSSGSMDNSDPDLLRRTSARLLVSLLDTGDEVGFVEFSDGIKSHHDLVQISADSRSKAGIITDLNGIKNGGSWTLMKEAFDEACRMMARARSENERYVILLTDGKPERKTNEAPDTYQAYLRDTIAAAKACNAPVLAIGLSDQADLAFLNRLVNGIQTPRSKVFSVRDASGLPDAYLQVFGHLRDRNVVELSQQAEGQYALEVDNSALGVDFVLIGTRGNCATTQCLDITMSDQSSLPTTWTEKDFVVAVKDQPPGGTWQVKVNLTPPFHLRAIIKSRLRMRLISPPGGKLPISMPITVTAQLYEEKATGEIVVLAGQPNLTMKCLISAPPDGKQTEMIPLYDNGTGPDAVAGDGLFTNVYTGAKQRGTYTLTLDMNYGNIPVHTEGSMQVEVFPVPLITSPPSNQPIRLKAGDSVTLSADVPTEVVVKSASAQIKRLDGAQLMPDIVMSVTDGRLMGSFVPTEPLGKFLVVVSAQCDYAGTSYLARSMATAEIVFDQELIHNLTIVNFGRGFIIQDLQPVEATMQAHSWEPVQITAEVRGLPWLSVRVEPSAILPQELTPVRLYAAGTPPEAERRYTGELVFHATPSMQISPQDPLELILELGQPRIIHDLKSARFGGVDSLSNLQSLSPIKFAVTASVPGSTVLRARLIDKQGKEIDAVRPELKPDTLSNGSTSVELSLNPGAATTGAGLFRRLVLEGKVELSATGGAVVEPTTSVDFYLYERSWWEITLRRIRAAVTSVLGSSAAIVVALLLAEVLWLGISYWKGAVPAVTLQSTETGRTHSLANYNGWRQRIFGVLIAAERTGPSFERPWDKILGWIWAKLLKADAIDIKLPSGQAAPDGPARRRPGELSSRVRLIGHGANLVLFNLDEQNPVRLTTAVEDGQPLRRSGRPRTVRYGQSETLEKGMVINLKGTGYKFGV